MTDLLQGLLADLRAEGDELRATVEALGADGWTRQTPAPGWTVATQVVHLMWTDEVAVLAARSHESPDAMAAWDDVVLKAIDDPLGYVDAAAFELAELPRDEVLVRWDKGRDELQDALRSLPAGQKLPWFGPPMSAASMATARFMETWAHSLDVHEALGVEPERTDRIRHVAHLGARTRNFAYSVHGLDAPADEFRIELTAPSGDLWTYGPEDSAQTIQGSAWDFCLLVTQRVHRRDTDLVAQGRDANEWLSIAQAFAGPPGPGREPR
jgi:uncharacterized protein (TIGR03084 family)